MQVQVLDASDYSLITESSNKDGKGELVEVKADDSVILKFDSELIMN